MADQRADKRPVYRRWPKRKGQAGEGPRTDKDKLREIYLANPHYAWEEFCKDQGFDPRPAQRHLFPVRHWQQDWLNQQVQATEDGLMPEALVTKKFIALGRLNFPKEWDKTAKALKSLADHVIQSAMMDAAWDQQNAELIRQNPKSKRFHLQPKDISTLALAQLRIQKLQHCALLIPSQDAFAAAIPIRETDPEVTESAAEQARLESMGPELIGGGVLDENTMTSILNRWIDQSAKGAEENGIHNSQTVEPETDPDAPLPAEEVDA